MTDMTEAEIKIERLIRLMEKTKDQDEKSTLQWAIFHLTQLFGQ